MLHYEKTHDNMFFNSCDAKHSTLAGSYFVALIMYKYFTGKDVTKLSDKVSGCIDCPVPYSKHFRKCFDCCYKPSLKDQCSECDNKTLTLPSELVRKLQSYVQYE